MILNGGYNYYGIPLGVISLDSRFPKPPNHIKHAASFDFPILYKTVKGATVARLIKERDPALLAPFLDAARELEQEGVKAITGSCGFLALYQKEIAAAVSIPVFMSSLIQVPLVSRMLGADRAVGVVVADQHSLTREHLHGVGISDEPIAIAGMQDQPQFRDVILQAQRNDLDMERFALELDQVVDALLAEHANVGALVLECTDLSHFALALQARTGLPVFDLSSLSRMVVATTGP
ncbi:aspartate/glutamate racemase family protein [Alcaligenes sp. SDU_A2]|uniref:aspartate/glutamate racemase family protein n=1 Tax=Alcaligenes sp. SDU_A2 TaxID=3136634 RepID=UPI00311FA858